MHKLWQASLTRSVIVTLACAMSVLWLLSEYRHSKAEAEVREDLAKELNGEPYSRMVKATCAAL